MEWNATLPSPGLTSKKNREYEKFFNDHVRTNVVKAL